MKRVTVSNNVIRRLPRYLRKLGELEEQGVARISSKELGESLGLTPSQIRQDFSCFGEFGQQGYGYNITALKGEIKSILGMDRGYRRSRQYRQGASRQFQLFRVGHNHGLRLRYKGSACRDLIQRRRDQICLRDGRLYR